jgi:hypothetical protein
MSARRFHVVGMGQKRNAAEHWHVPRVHLAPFQTPLRRSSDMIAISYLVGLRPGVLAAGMTAHH